MSVYRSLHQKCFRLSQTANVNLGKVHIQTVLDFWVSMDASFMFSHVSEAPNSSSNGACWSYILHYHSKLFVWRDSIFFFRRQNKGSRSLKSRGSTQIQIGDARNGRVMIQS